MAIGEAPGAGLILGRGETNAQARSCEDVAGHSARTQFQTAASLQVVTIEGFVQAQGLGHFPGPGAKLGGGALSKP